MKKLIFFLISFLATSAVYAGTTVIINNQLTAKNANGNVWINGSYDTQGPGWRGGSSFNNLPSGNNVISSQWPVTMTSGKIQYITGDYVDHSGNGKTFVASSSCKNIKIMPNVTNRITVTPGFIFIASIKMPATICTVSYK